MHVASDITAYIMRLVNSATGMQLSLEDYIINGILSPEACILKKNLYELHNKAL